MSTLTERLSDLSGPAQPRDKPRQDEELVNRRLEANRKIGEHTSEVEGYTFKIYPTVFSPEVNSSTRWACSVVPYSVAPTSPGGCMLEIGTGCGAISIVSALKGCPSVTATDINPNAVECARFNAQNLGVADRMEIFVSDIFNAIPEGRKYDVVFWNFPFNFPTKPESIRDMDYCAQSLYDPGYQLLERYLAQVRRYLKPNGQVFITFSPDTGNAERFQKLTAKHEWVPYLFAFRDCSTLGGTHSACFNLYRLVDCSKTNSE